MVFSKEPLDEILKNCHGPDDFYGPSGIMRRLAKAPVERDMEAELTGRLGCRKHGQGAKPSASRQNGKTAKELRADDGPVAIEVPRIAPKRHGKRSFHRVSGF
ncbi:MAG: transposase [Treponema sp.]|jgi:transposase-like protein|nr:transposase [Treponema sp.]